MRRSFANQVAVITGASSGIGWELAKALAAEKCKVGLIARRKENLDRLVGEIAASGGVAVAAPADVADRRQVQSAVAVIVERLGPVDLMVANAGMGGPTNLEPLDIPLVERVFQVNFFGVIYALEAVLPDMLQRGTGHVAAVSSMAAYKGLPGESAYCASKAAINSYLEGLRLHLRPRNIAVTTICPGFVRTPITAGHPFSMPFMMNADKAARKIVHALRRRKKVYNFPWQMTWLMELTRWVPDWLMYWGVKHTIDNPPTAGEASTSVSEKPAG